jgi:hypothetical protein
MKSFFFVLVAVATVAPAQTTQPFDGTPWNVSTGNLSVSFIQASPIGAHPRPDVLEPPPPADVLKRQKADGLVAYEDYVGWGAIEREPGKWDWRQHDAIMKAQHDAGLKYVVYPWLHFPPKWLRDDKKSDRTLMRCVEHDKETNYLSVFDPKTIEHYDRFYAALKEHFGDKIDGVYAAILGPYGEGNYPLYIPDWVNMGHCHEGFWCGDAHARKAFAAAMKKKYGDDIGAMNRAWGSDYKTFDDIRPPKAAHDEKLRITPDTFVTAADRRRWLDFITWYHQAIIDFAGESIRVTTKYFPAKIVKTKPGGNAGGVNPIAWGTYCPGYAKMAGKYPGVTLQPADWRGAYFGDKWVATAYQFYKVNLGTEPAGGLDRNGFLQRLFSDASCGTKQLFTYEFDQHAADIRKHARLVTGVPGETEVAVLCPTTLYRLGGDLKPTIDWSHKLRDLTDFDVLDELLIADGALKIDRYKFLLIFQGDFIDQPILDHIDAFIAAGGTVVVAGRTTPANVDGTPWPQQKVTYTRGRPIEAFKKLADASKPRGYDGKADGVWVTRRGEQTIMLNTAGKPVTARGVTVPAHELIDTTVPAP